MRYAQEGRHRGGEVPRESRHVDARVRPPRRVRADRDAAEHREDERERNELRSDAGAVPDRGPDRVPRRREAKRRTGRLRRDRRAEAVADDAGQPAPVAREDRVGQVRLPRMQGTARGPWRQAARRFRGRPLGVAALTMLIVFAIVGLLARTIAPYAADDEFIRFLGDPQPPLSPHHLLGTDARVVRASVASLRVREYVEAAHALGASNARVVVRHLLPNALGTVLVAATSVAGQSIVLVATVDYLGYGFNEYTRPTLGGLLAVAAKGITAPGSFTAVDSPRWLFVFPAVLLVLLLACVNLVGDALDDALNPRA
jgi:ABC-type dipeptide/oligopeptide/nickel transport system permease subunit